MAVSPTTRRIVDRALDSEGMSRDDALLLMDLHLDSDDCYAVLAAANRFTHRESGSRGTVYSQVGINVWPCPENCDFCYLATKHGIVTQLHEYSIDDVRTRALDFEAAGADEVYLMTTANFPLGRFLEIGQDVRRALRPDTELIANIGDFKRKEGLQLRDAGFDGVYHVYRFREGIDTAIEPERRRATFAAIREVGLDLRYCVEPVGPEHTNEEIVEQMCLAQEFGAGILSVMRRIPVPGTPFARAGLLTEPQRAQIVGISRPCPGTASRQMAA